MRTLTLHHDKHHASYVDKLNTLSAELRRRPTSWLLLNVDPAP
ncbi:MAG: hypothetical protein ACXWT3_02005 [Methylococcaceae bacterium]